MLSELNKILPRTILCDAADACGTDKGKHGYTRLYYELFKCFRDGNISLLEIGVRKGSSIKMWQHFFTHGQVFGIDIKPSKLKNCAVADQGNKEQVLHALDYFKTYGFDIIVDDGSHMQGDQQKSLGILFPYLNKGGYYVIEDVANRDRLLEEDSWGQNADATDSTDYVFTQYKNTGQLKSPYLTQAENVRLMDEISEFYIYDESNRMNSPVSGTSKLIIIRKNEK